MNTRLNDDFCHATDAKHLIHLLNHFNPDQSVCFSAELSSKTTFPRPVKLWITGTFTGDFNQEDMGKNDESDITEWNWSEFRIQFETRQELLDAVCCIVIPENEYTDELKKVLQKFDLIDYIEII